MELDQLLNLTSVVAGKLLPICGVIALIFLCIFLRKLIKVMISTNDAVTSMKTTLDSANRQLEALDKPMQTLNELSETVDCVHEASKNAVKSALVTIIDNIGTIKDAFMPSKKDKEQPTENVNEPLNASRGEQDGTRVE